MKILILLVLLWASLPFAVFGAADVLDDLFFGDDGDVLDLLFLEPQGGAGSASRSQQQATVEIQMRIDGAQNQINYLTTQENTARTLRSLARDNLSRAREELDDVDNKYEEALMLFNAAPQNRIAQIMYADAAKEKEAAQEIYDNESKKANIVENLWIIASGELNRERETLVELREMQRKLNAGEISADEIRLSQTQTAIDALETGEKSARETLENDLSEATEMFREQIERDEQLREQFFRAQFESEFKSYRVFSVRPEFITTGAVMGVGATAEFGKINTNGLYLSSELSLGAAFLGGWFNIGMCFNKDGGVKNVLGLGAGAHFSGAYVDFRNYNGTWLGRDKEINMNFVGAFHKLLIGREKNIDITNRFMLGYRRNPVDFLKETDSFVYDNGLGMAYTLSIGYTLTRVRGQR
ncbi:MAG: hypothetical protein FWE23_11090 [Chitinivibrionia bacterium]|nr:hypothetical protein [Chitinivibrionia bacterium]